MIVPMRKATVIVQGKDSDSAVAALRSLGVMHIEHQRLPRGREIGTLQEELAVLDAAIGILSEPEFFSETTSAPGASTPGVDEVKEWKRPAQHIIELRKRLDHLAEYSRTMAAQIEQWRQWGDFDPASIKRLSEKGIHIKLYQIPKGELKNLRRDNIIVKELFSGRGGVGCAVISRQGFELPFPEIIPPKMGLHEMQSRLDEDLRVMDSIRGDIQRYGSLLAGLMFVRKGIAKELEFSEVIAGMGQEGALSYVSGYIPYDMEVALASCAKREKWGVVIKEPSDEDNVPTLVRNPRWISIISPVFKLIEIIPGYKELDISISFLVFFSIFFGMLIGDAGYGLAFLALTAAAHAKFRNRLRDNAIFVLFYLLSACAIGWGLLSGTFFGQEWLGAFFKPVFPALRDDRTVQALCFFIGALHLSIAHAWRVVVKLPSLSALSDAGWIFVLWGANFLAKTLILGEPLPSFVKWFFLIGASLVVLFTAPKRNVLKGLGAGLGNLLLNAVNSFTDVVSYIRLFAVGLATVAVADSFNKMAMEVGYNNFFTGIVTSLILLLGHGLNIALGPMSVLVHGVRLNVLEFCSHIDIKWSGFAYRPLREEAITDTSLSPLESVE